MRLLLTTPTLVAGLALSGLANAQPADVRMPIVECDGHPEIVRVENVGSSAQDMSGWSLQSDLPGETFDLGVVGTLDGGEIIFVFNGHLSPPSDPANGYYQWDPLVFFLRDNDGTDFMRLVDPQGNVVNEVRCGPLPVPTTQPVGPDQQDPPPGQTSPSAADGYSQDTTALGQIQRAPEGQAGDAGGQLPAGGGRPYGDGWEVPPLLIILAGGAAVSAGALLVSMASRRRGQD